VISPLDPYSGFISVLFMLSITGVKAAYEDYQRHLSDDEINSKKASIWTPNGIKEMLWGDITVGDVLELNADDEFPADCIILDVISSDNRCRIETAALDGETNLKSKYCIKEADFKIKTGIIEISPPTIDLSVFSGKIIMPSGNEHFVDVNNFVPRACVLRKTHQVHALVVYTGENTKVILNSAKPNYKFTELDKFLSRFVLIMAIVILFISIGYAFLSYRWSQSHLADGYLLLGAISNDQFYYNIFSWMLIINLLIPLSVYSSLDLVRFFLAQSITNDRRMMEIGRSSCCRNSDLVATIGRVTNVFSDKTGTLTKNLMTFRSVAFEERLLGLWNPDEYEEDGFNDLSEMSVMNERLVNLHPVFIEWIKENSQALDVHLFLLSIVLCNSAVTASNTKYYSIDDIKSRFPEFEYSYDIPPPEVVYEFPYSITFQTSSPDEIALLHLARECEYILYSVEDRLVKVIIRGELLCFERPIIFEFNSKRKRASVITKLSDHWVMLAKGADNVIGARSSITESLTEQLSTIVAEGLRTLCFAYKVVEDFDTLYELYQQKKSLTVGAEEEIEAIAEQHEIDLMTFAISGVEDELQDKVQDTLQCLRLANINIWMLTGDKLDTALNIAKTSGLMQKNDKSVVLTPNDTAEHFKCLEGLDLSKTVVAIEGANLNLIIDNEKIAEEFLGLAGKCAGVVCARCEPSQKGNIVRRFRENNPKATTLAIGDGGNDVDMIRAAHVGVGVEGKEGTEAVMSSDFSIPSFRHISRLLIVHGRWCANRSAILILLTFYKNTMMAIIQLLYGVFNGFSATSAFDSGFYSLYNVLLTIPQLFFICIFEEDLDAKFALAIPQVYIETQQSGGLGAGPVIEWYLSAIIHSCLIFFYSLFESNSVLLSSTGITFDLPIFTQITGWTVLIVFTAVLIIRFRTLSWLHFGLYFGCVVIYSLIELVYSYLDPYFYNILSIIFSIPRIWFTVPLVVGFSIILELVLIYMKPLFSKSVSNAVAELEYASKL